jgi:hypothetical protein
VTLLAAQCCCPLLLLLAALLALALPLCRRRGHSIHPRLRVRCACCARAQDKDGPKALEEFCRDLCEDVRLNKIDPVSAAGGGAAAAASDSAGC